MSFQDFLAPYEILKELGKGGFSIVYLAKERATGKLVAIKVIDKDVDNENALKTEFSIQREFESPYIVNILSYYEDESHFLLVIEYVNGGELFDAIVNEGAYSEFDAAKLVQQILIGLKVLHDNNVIHRDLKPENLLLSIDEKTGETTVKISDFGLAGIFSDEKISQYCGTEGYAAPEIMNNVPYDSSVDIWSLGVIVYILLCGFRPFESDDRYELYQQVTSGTVEFPSPEWDEISKEAIDFISQMLKIDPTKRITIEDALNHPWIAGHAPKIQLGDLRQHLKKFNLKRKLKRVANATKAAILFKKISLL
ncbi:Serine/threonine-protein kinase brsk2 [Tritrichomonas musculus]|uniref:Serine/threonine-protein kinase brsk2 n=1 Tax=Tritrichomonas musculus TaxID=1915356 RepID=A0ABR2IPG2_9EUKA